MAAGHKVINSNCSTQNTITSVAGDTQTGFKQPALLLISAHLTQSVSYKNA